jgi:hypothetical protein
MTAKILKINTIPEKTQQFYSDICGLIEGTRRRKSAKEIVYEARNLKVKAKIEN